MLPLLRSEYIVSESDRREVVNNSQWKNRIASLGLGAAILVGPSASSVIRSADAS